MSEIIVLEKSELVNLIEGATRKAIAIYMQEAESKKNETLISKRQAMVKLKIGAEKLNDLLINGKIAMHSCGKIKQSSIDNYLRSC